MTDTAKSSLNVVVDEMIIQRDLQLRNINSLDSKAGVLLGFESLLFVSILKEQYGNLLDIFGFVLLVGSLAFLVIAVQLKGFKFNPHPKVLHEDYMYRQENPNQGEKQASSKEQILADQIQAYKENEQNANQKAFWVKWAIILLLASVLVLGASKIGGIKMSGVESQSSERITKSDGSQGQTERPAEEPARPNPAADNTFEKSIGSGK